MLLIDDEFELSMFWQKTVYYANKSYVELMAKLNVIVEKSGTQEKKPRGEPVGDILAFFSKMQSF